MSSQSNSNDTYAHAFYPEVKKCNSMNQNY